MDSESYNQLQQLRPQALFRLTIPEFAPTEAPTPAVRPIFRCDSLLLASDKASQLTK